jgi:hypothetical protein
MGKYLAHAWQMVIVDSLCLALRLLYLNIFLKKKRFHLE